LVRCHTLSVTRQIGSIKAHATFYHNLPYGEKMAGKGEKMAGKTSLSLKLLIDSNCGKLTSHQTLINNINLERKKVKLYNQLFYGYYFWNLLSLRVKHSKAW